MFADNARFDPSCDFDFLAVVVEPVGHHRFRAVFVRRHLLRWERRGVVELLIVSPVSAAAKFPLATFFLSPGSIILFSSGGISYFAGRDIVLFVIPLLLRCC